jgi:hypothetical protein
MAINMGLARLGRDNARRGCRDAVGAMCFFAEGGRCRLPSWWAPFESRPAPTRRNGLGHNIVAIGAMGASLPLRISDALHESGNGFDDGA